MSRTLNEQREYQRGYQAGTRHEWSALKPPQPPHEIVAGYIKAATELRNEVQSVLQTICADDEWALMLWPKIEALDLQTQRIVAWLRDDAFTKSKP